jgi:hypothetical protein
MDDRPQPGQAFMSALVTEHFVLQSARSTTVSEAVGRMAVYLTCVSSSLVAFGFFAAATHRLAPVVATVLPALIILGVLTFVRLVETAVENVMFLMRIEAIRGYYAILAGAGAALLLHVAGVLVPEAVIVGAVAALLTFGLQMTWMYRRGQHLMA